ncbi:hypothetical protein PPERSA_12877 [Pseudocohnilembus persalinus]|uniref:Uncharacterized protein n=1 Tax=Pseudocohnilembus persalinus TaxID=266149 RepID=A0A0V0Q878_PSEPJ|nr:hypothetical protein PPERSA_12877 [Pseudocohnilembus persalinus]|eukprot:KRW98398.1 hypothetical protein PPERSA_12877 [Pseudocohnilembus persalinus]
MSKISNLLRYNNNINQIIRGAKKKKAGGGGKAEKVDIPEDLVNIFKDKKDEPLKNINEYPQWLFNLALPLSPPSVYHTAWQTDNEVYKPEGKDMVRYIKSLRREKIKYQNYQAALHNKDLTEQVVHPYQKNLFMQASMSKGDGEEGESQEAEEEE